MLERSSYGMLSLLDSEILQRQDILFHAGLKMENGVINNGASVNASVESNTSILESAGQGTLREHYSTTPMYCKWTGKGNIQQNATHGLGCSDLLSSIQKTRHIVFLGDSTMAYLFEQFMPQIKEIFPSLRRRKTSQKKNSKQCPRLDYFGLPLKQETAENWLEPQKGVEGPSPFAAWTTPFCMGCNRCIFQKFADQSNNVTVEYIGLEYARDVEYQTNVSHTSQETVSLYLKSQALDTSKVTCIANAGFHDLTVQYQTVDQYVENVHFYLDHFHHLCGTIIWVGLSKTLNNKDFPQTHDNITKLNNALFETLAASPDRWNHLKILDVYDAGQNFRMKDNLHFFGRYYRVLSVFLLRIMHIVTEEEAHFY